MKNSVLFPVIGLFSVIFASCGKDGETSSEDNSETPVEIGEPPVINCGNDGRTSFKIDGLTFDNYPKVDGSTSTQPLNMLIACRLLGVCCDWEPGGRWGFILPWEFWLKPNPEDIPASDPDFFTEHVKVSQTHGAFMNLIDKNADLIMTHRTLSPDEKAHADEAGVRLIETPVALDAFVFVVNKDNPVKSLTTARIQDIYTGTITNWNRAGGKDEKMYPFVRPRNSGSQEVMESLVMNGKEISDEFKNQASEIVSMAGVFAEMRSPGAICYTFDYYKRVMVRVTDGEVPRICVNGIFPSEKSIKSRTYPFVSEVHVAIRAGQDKNSMTYKLYELLTSDTAKPVIAESGYIPN
ncbi:MAG: substrate-binding domain-containing protein [Tannerella sp.]|jgi:phosphate transport system substrate-binding protein|nr:substrate-binding domain-containing protein [Tannerella sp.]